MKANSCQSVSAQSILLNSCYIWVVEAGLLSARPIYMHQSVSSYLFTLSDGCFGVGLTMNYAARSPRNQRI